MKNTTRKLYNMLIAGMAKKYGIEPADVEKAFSIDIPQETSLNDKIRESSEFLNMITMQGVDDSKGQALEMGVSGLLAKRTQVSGSTKRQPTMLGSPDGSKWETALTEFDVGINYLTLDQWARYKDFFERYMMAVYSKIALDRLTIGFHGQSVAAQSDPVANPLGQDVNKGWHKILQENNSANYMTQSGSVADKITIGAAGDYKNLDALAYDLLSGIPVQHRTGDEVVIVGAALVADDVNKGLTKHAQTPSEKTNGITKLAGSYGGLNAVQVPKFPDMGVMVTDTANLQLLYQEGKMRRHAKEEPESNRVVDYISSNDAYAIGNTKAIAAVNADNVEFKES